MFQIFDLIWDAEVVSRNYDKTSELNVMKILAFDSTFILVKFISEGVQSVEKLMRIDSNVYVMINSVEILWKQYMPNERNSYI